MTVCTYVYQCMHIHTYAFIHTFIDRRCVYIHREGDIDYRSWLVCLKKSHHLPLTTGDPGNQTSDPSWWWQ